jgi:hypothetical protein
MIERQIRLYRRGEGKGDALNGFSAAKGELAHISLLNIGEILSKNVPQDVLKGVSEVIPNGEGVVKGLKTLALDIKVSPDGTTKQSISLEAASENDADMLRTLAKTGLITATAQAEKDYEAIYKRMSISGVDFAEQIEVERFRPKGEGELDATFIHKDGYEEDFELEYITFDNHVLVWVVG